MKRAAYTFICGSFSLLCQYFFYVRRRCSDGDDVNPVKSRQGAANGKNAVVAPDKGIDVVKTGRLGRDGAVSGYGAVNAFRRRPFFAKTTVQKKKEIRNAVIRFNERHHIFPVEEGDLLFFVVPRNIPQSRAAVP